MNNIKHGAVYIRVSTEEQTNYSPDSQLKLIRKYANDHDIEILEEHIYRDEGISGRNTDKRESFNKMIYNAKKKPKPFDCILVYDFSRFARNREDSIIYKTMLRKKLNIDVISITQPLNEGKESVLLEAMYEAMDEYYSLNLSENSLRGKLEKASRGEHQGNPPYGYIYNKNTKMIEIDPEKADIVRLIFSEWIKPGSTIRSIILKLNGMGIKTTRGCSWADRSLHIILRNPAYIGYTRFCPGGMRREWHNPNIRIVKGKHEPIIDEDTWNKAQEKMRIHDEQWFKYKKPAPKHEHWLRGILKCSECGKSLVKVKVHSKKTAYFQCTWYTKGRCTCNQYVREDVIVPAILERIKAIYEKKIEVDVTFNDHDNSEIDILNKELTKLNNKLKRNKEMYLEGVITIDELKQNKNSIEKSILEVKNRLKELDYDKMKEEKKNKIIKFCKTAYELLIDSKVDEKIKSEISHNLFEYIIYDRQNNTLSIKYK